eukprot:2819778-Pyramimonas_sp.AAC.1
MTLDPSQAAKSLEDMVQFGRVDYQREYTLTAKLAPKNAFMAYLGNAAMEASAPTRFIRAALWPNWQTRRLSDTSRYAPTAR